MLFLCKICPQGAIAARPYADFCPMGGVCTPYAFRRFHPVDCKFRNGAIKRFQFPIRTTPEGSIKALAKANPQAAALITNACLPKRSWQNPQTVLGKKFEVEDPGMKRKAAKDGVLYDPEAVGSNG